MAFRDLPTQSTRLAAYRLSVFSDAETWLSRAKVGYCGETRERGDCVAGDKGTLDLSATIFSAGWSKSAAACLVKCKACARCRFVSVSLLQRDCSWYATCQMEALAQQVSGFRTASALAPHTTVDTLLIEQLLSLDAVTSRASELDAQLAGSLVLLEEQRRAVATQGAAVAFDYYAGVRCRSSQKRLAGPARTQHRAACTRACWQSAGCAAAQWNNESKACKLFAQCLHRTHGSPSISVMHRSGPSWPVSRAADVRWRTNASLVLASYSGGLGWLRKLSPSGLLDVVVYQKSDHPAGSHGWAAHAARRLAQFCASLCGGCSIPGSCAKSALAYFSVLPNYGSVDAGSKRGGSREPLVYLRFLHEFYDNLSPVVIFAQVRNSSRPRFACSASHARAIALRFTVASRPLHG